MYTHVYIIDAMNNKSKQTLLRYLNKLDKGDPTAPEETEIDPRYLYMHIHSASLYILCILVYIYLFDMHVFLLILSFFNTCSYLEVERLLDVREEEVSEVVDAAGEALPMIPLPAPEDSPRINPASTPTAVSASLVKTSSKASLATNGEELTDTEAVETGVDEEELKLSVHALFNPVERSRKVLEKIWDDPGSLSFQEPVDLATYDDYLDVVEKPMCLRDVLNKINAGEYKGTQNYRGFLRDMRLIWQNCKAYNLYKSQIWLTAHAFSLMFERLYQAWVTSYSDGKIRFEDPLGQPWQSSCRKCLEDENDGDLMLCDHCDAAYHIYCLKPKLTKVPEGSWICKRCTEWFERTGAPMLSATMEDEARHIAETAGYRKIIKIKKKKYLVKWRGLSYKECTWETAKDINDDEIIAQFHKSNDEPPEEPPLTQAEIGIELSKDRRGQLIPALTRPSAVQDLDATVYAQIRSLHFLRFSKVPPETLIKECGPAGLALTRGVRHAMLLPAPIADSLERIKRSTLVSDDHGDSAKVKDLDTKLHADKRVWVDPHREDSSTTLNGHKSASYDPVREHVAEALSSMLYCVARASLPNPQPARDRLPKPSMTHGGEIEVCIRKGGQPSLCMKLGEKGGLPVVAGFQPNAKGHRGPVEATGRVKHGDILIGINSVSLLGMKFDSVIALLGTQSAQSAYLYLRFFRSLAYTYSNPAMVTRGASAYDPLKEYLNFRREHTTMRPPLPRSLYYGVFPSRLSALNEVETWDAICFDRDSKSSVVVGSYSDEREAAIAFDTAVASSRYTTTGPLNFTDNTHTTLTPEAKTLFNVVTAEREAAEALLEEYPSYKDFARDTTKGDNGAVAMEVTDAQPAVSKGEGGEDEDASPEMEDQKNISHVTLADADLASYDSDDSDSALDPSDAESLASFRRPAAIAKVDSDDSAASDDSDDSADDGDDQWASDDENEWKPIKDVLLPGDGPMSRLLRAVNQSELPPIRSEWTNYVLEMGFPKKVVIDPRLRKIEQVDMASGTVIRVWDSTPLAARMLNIASCTITKALQGQTELAGGFNWRFAQVAASSQSLDEDAEDDVVNVHLSVLSFICNLTL